MHGILRLLQSSPSFFNGKDLRERLPGQVKMRLIITLLIAGIVGSAATSVISKFLTVDPRAKLRQSYAKEPARSLSVVADVSSICFPKASASSPVRERVLAMAPQFVMAAVKEDQAASKKDLQIIIDTQIQWLKTAPKKEQDEFFNALADEEFLRCTVEKAAKIMENASPVTEDLLLRGGL
jgi:hypothetical protein